MTINMGIIGQRVKHIAKQYKINIQEQLNTTKQDEHFLTSVAFVLLCIQIVLDKSPEEAINSLTEGGNDAGIDGLHIGDLQNDEFTVTIFQGKYQRKLEGFSNFPENAIVKLLVTLKALFDPDKTLNFNPQLQPRIEEIRALVLDGYRPNVRVMLCNNGLPWKPEAQQYINAAGFGNQVSWFHINHDHLVESLLQPKSISDKLQLVGEAVIEEFNYRRVLIGKISVNEIKNLFDRYGDKLLESNLRRYLGLHHNRVNQEIRQSLLEPEKRPNFYFYNNGITMICNQFRYNALQHKNYSVKINNLQIINGGQTCMTITNTLRDMPDDDFEAAFVLLRLYELEDLNPAIVEEITKATNNQTPVDLRDYRSNDDIQRKLEIAAKDLGYEYKRKRDAIINGASNIIPATVAAKAVFAIWRRKPYLVQFREKEIFGQFYEEIFNDKLNSAQLIMGVLIFRMVDSERKRYSDDGVLRFIPYATYFLAMLTGEELLEQLNISLENLDHRNFAQVKATFEESRDNLYQLAINKLDVALKKMYNDYQNMSLQRLAATFRRGDLLEIF
jgi:hypothetical protein